MIKRNVAIFVLACTVLLVFTTGKLRSQPVEGTIRYLRTDNFAKMMASLDYMSKQQVDRMIYMWGNRAERKTYTLLQVNTTGSKYENSEEEAEPGYQGWSDRKETFFMKCNFVEKTIYDGIPFLGTTYLIHDSLVPPAWKILNDMKEVAGHICMDASWTDTLRKQNVLAWFALDMPVSAGPDRFTGLPGLILEIEINDGALFLTADKIDLKPITTELDVPQKVKGKKINLTTYNLMFEKTMKEKREAEEPWFWGISY